MSPERFHRLQQIGGSSSSSKYVDMRLTENPKEAANHLEHQDEHTILEQQLAYQGHMQQKAALEQSEVNVSISSPNTRKKFENLNM